MGKKENRFEEFLSSTWDFLAAGFAATAAGFNKKKKKFQNEELIGQTIDKTLEKRPLVCREPAQPSQNITHTHITRE